MLIVVFVIITIMIGGAVDSNRKLLSITEHTVSKRGLLLTATMPLCNNDSDSCDSDSASC